MEAVSRFLQPHKDLIGQTASIVTIGQFFSGVFVCKDIYKKGTTAGTPAIPFIGGIVIGCLMLKHGMILNDPAMLQVNVAAIFLNVLYTMFYYMYSPDKQQDVLKPLGIGIAIVAVFLGYTEVEDPSNLEFRYGLIVTILMLLLLGSPLVNLKNIIEKKDASSIPFPLTFMGALVTFLWLIYGVVLLNIFMIIQNVIGFTLCALQLVLIFQYPGNPSEGQNKKKNKTSKKD